MKKTKRTSTKMILDLGVLGTQLVAIYLATQKKNTVNPTIMISQVVDIVALIIPGIPVSGQE